MSEIQLELTVQISCIEMNISSLSFAGCTKEGRHADKTSKLHFIECVPGSIALRYKCRSGQYDPKARECKNKQWKLMDITVDVSLDTPADVHQYQKDWEAATDPVIYF